MLNQNQILEILKDWNFWDTKFPELIERETYEQKIKLFRKSNEIIVLTGIRRSGKSSLLKREISSLLKKIKKEQILFINFEDPRFSENLDYTLLDKILETYKIHINPDKEIFLFLDEIQNISLWEKWVRTKHELNQANIYLTGSSSKLLSRELGSVLTGRCLNIEVYPLSFKEFLFFKGIKINSKLDIITKKIKIQKLFLEYIKFGGFPKIVLQDETIKSEEIKNYFSNILQKDIMLRYNLKNYDNLLKLALYIISNNTLLYSANNLKNTLGISLESVLNYVSYLKETYLIYELSKFSYSVKEQSYSKKKLYIGDLGLINSLSFNFSENIGRILESFIFLELKKNGKEIYYHKKEKECDFIIKEGINIIEAIQVTQSLNNPKTKKREIEGLIEACKTYKLKEGLILTEDEEDQITLEEITIHIKPIWKWCLKSKNY